MSSDNQVSRRDLFLGAGMTAGALAAIGAVGGIAYAPATQAALSKSRQYYATNVALELDGTSAGRLISAQGGEPVFVPVSAPDGAQRSGATLRYEPLTVRLGDMSAAMYDWIGKATLGSALTHGVTVATSNSDTKETYRLVMQQVRLTEILLDELDAGAAATDSARFMVKMLPGLSSHQFGGKAVATSIPSQKISPIFRSSFRLYIQGVEAATTRARSIEAVGLNLEFGVVPKALKFVVPFNDAGPLFTWMQETLAGKPSARPGELQLLTRDQTRVAASVGFSQLMIVRISCPVEAASTTGQFAEIECVPSAVSFNMGELLK